MGGGAITCFRFFGGASGRAWRFGDLIGLRVEGCGFWGDFGKRGLYSFRVKGSESC